AGRLRLFRYEIRCWREGEIPDAAEAVASPRRLSVDPDCARRLLALTTEVPTPAWGRDELHTGEMWNSNSVTSWLLARSGVEVQSIQPPLGGRAPGWKAGIGAAGGSWAATACSQRVESLRAANAAREGRRVPCPPRGCPLRDSEPLGRRLGPCARRARVQGARPAEPGVRPRPRA